MNFKVEGTNWRNKIISEIKGGTKPNISANKNVIGMIKMIETIILIFRNREPFIPLQDYTFNV